MGKSRFLFSFFNLELPFYLTFLHLLLGVENVKGARCGDGGQVLGGCSNPDIVCAVLCGAALYLKDRVKDTARAKETCALCV